MREEGRWYTPKLSIVKFDYWRLKRFMLSHWEESQPFDKRKSSRLEIKERLFAKDCFQFMLPDSSILCCIISSYFV